jgi:hypothetical protein
MTFMVHPEHGATNVSDAEVPAMEKRGWVVSTHEAEMARMGKGVPPPVEPEPKKRVGRPPKAN